MQFFVKKKSIWNAVREVQIIMIPKDLSLNTKNGQFLNKLKFQNILKLVDKK
jgi:hypothetical protein